MSLSHFQPDSQPYWFEGMEENFFKPLDHLPAEMDAVIIGGGIMGVSTGYWLAKLGVETLLLEAQYLGAGATGRNSGLMLHAASEIETPGPLLSFLAEEKIDAEYRAPGHLALASTHETWNAFKAEAERRKGNGLPLLALERDECERLLGMRLSAGFKGGRWFPGGAVIHSVKLVHGMAIAARRRGLRISSKTQVVEVRSGADKALVRTSRGDLKTRYVIYACGADVMELVPEFRTMIRRISVEVLATKPLPRLFQTGMAVDWGTVYWRQTADGTIIMGGDASDFLKSQGASEADCAPPALEKFLSVAFPGFPASGVRKKWTGVMDCSRDGKPIVGPIGGRGNEWAVVGFNGHGMPLGLGVGREVAHNIVTGIRSQILDRFNPARLHLMPVQTLN
jgi:gamma-glutamylputrescine oxidase